MFRRRYDKRVRLLLILLASMTALICIELARQLELPRLLESFEAKAYDLRMSLPLLQGPHRPSPDIAILVFDDPTLYLYEDEYGTWPWPRSLHAQMMTFLNKYAQPRLLSYDLLFLANRKGERLSDDQLVRTYLTTPNALLAMNLDQFLDQTRTLGKELTPWQRLLLQPMKIPVNNHLSPRSPNKLKLDATGFYSGAHITYNNFRPILEPLYQAGGRLQLINHARDEDGVSRSNPLIFRYKAPQPQHSTALPFRLVHRGMWQDHLGRSVTQTGWLLDGEGRLIQREQSLYLPHMSLRMLEILDQQRAKASKRPWKQPIYALSPDGELLFGSRRVPLSADGRFFINWYNINIDQEAWQKLLVTFLYPERDRLLKLANTPDTRQKLAVIKKQIVQAEERVAKVFTPKLYPMISVARLLEAMHHERHGGFTATDKLLIQELRGKILFIGSLAVSSFDIKTTPTSRVMPGIVQQAVLFDNLYQNQGYIHRATPNTNHLIALSLCMLTIFSILTFRSAWMGLAAAAGTLIAYLCYNLWLFKQQLLWLDIVLPLLAMLIAIIVAFVVKYVGRDRDYERTYKLATTDGLTGLHNHRYFQEFLQGAMQATERTRRPTALLLVDIDFFKKFNDAFGHQAGDMVLRAVAQKLKQSVRVDDLVARYGGEEMAIILPETDGATAVEVAGKVVRQIAAEAYEIASDVREHVTISVGVAVYPEDGATSSELIEVADEGLYRAKKAGRNCVGMRRVEAIQKAEHLAGNPFIIQGERLDPAPTLTLKPNQKTD